MEYTQQIELKEVVANDEAIFFKVNVNGEDRIFVGQQNSRFDLEPEQNLSSVEQSDKLSAKLKIAESFQKSYLVDKPVQYQENVKKDVIIPAAVSKEIVQLGNYLYSLSKETNNSVLYLLYKNRLINRYVDDKMHCIYYDLDLTNKKYKDFLLTASAEKILKGEKDGPSDLNTYPGLISNFNLEELDKTVNKGKYLVYALEKTWVNPDAKEDKELSEYKNMEGAIDALEDGISVKSSLETMPYNLIYEYGEERQYETDASNVYADFIHLKNSLSPFFNVEVEDDYKFRLWRKFQRVGSTSNSSIYTVYSLDTPKTVSKTLNAKAGRLNVGNNNPYEDHLQETSYYDSVGSLAGSLVKTKVAYNFDKLGFTVHLDTPRRDLVDRFMFSYQRRVRSDANEEEAHLLYNTEQFFQWLVDTSDNLFYWKPQEGIKYPANTRFNLFNDFTKKGDGYITTVECIETPTDKDGQYTNIVTVDEPLDFEIPPFVEAFHFNYDAGAFSRIIDYKEVINPDGTTEMEGVWSTPVDFVEIYREKEFLPYTGATPGPIINWEKVSNEGGYEYDAFTLDYSEPGIETKKDSQVFAHKTIVENQESTEVLSDNWAHTKHWSIKLFEGVEEQKNWIYDVLDCRVDSEGNLIRKSFKPYIRKISDTETEELSLTAEEAEKLFPSESSVMESYKFSYPTYDNIKNAVIVDDEGHDKDYTATEFKALDTATKVKFLLNKLWKNMSRDTKGQLILSNNYPEISNPQLCNVNGDSAVGRDATTLEDVIAALDFYANYKMYWKKGDRVQYTNYRVSPYKTTLHENDSSANMNLYYGNSVDGQRISYFATPFEIRKAIGSSSSLIDRDPELTNFNTEVSLLDLFGLSIGGVSVEDRTNLESRIAAFFNKNKTDILSVDLVVSLKDRREQNLFNIEVFLNGQLVNSTEYSVDDDNRELIMNMINNVYNIRFWIFGKNKVETETKESGEVVNKVAYAAPFNYTNISMWNYPISLAQSQQIRRKVLERNSLDSVCADIYAIIDEIFTKVPKYDSADITYSKAFNLNYYKVSYDYAYDREDDEYAALQKLFKVQDFEFIDRIYGLNKLSGAKDRKSNLYSIRIKNSGFAITGDETEEEKEFKTAISSMLSAAVNTICEKVQPINTKLYSVIIES